VKIWQESVTAKKVWLQYYPDLFTGKKNNEKMTSQRSMNWCITWNNPPMYEDNTDWSEVQEPPNTWPNVKYVVWQLEQGENETPHYQIYVQFDKQFSLSTLKALLPAGLHLEPRKKSHAQARDYCKKEDTRIAGPWEFGTESHQGRDGALMPMLAAVDAGKDEKEIVAIDPVIWARYFRAIERYRNLTQAKRSDGDRVFTTVYWGGEDVGKSWRATTEAGPNHYKLLLPQDQRNTVWWDNYKGEEDVVIDEFKGQIAQTYMNTICDRYKAQVQTKHGMVNLNMRRLWITSNYNPKTWWPNLGLQRSFMKRITGLNGTCIKMTTAWFPETDGESLIAMIEERNAELAQKKKEIDELDAALDAELPDDSPLKKRRLEPPRYVAGGPAQQVGVNYRRDDPTNWYDVEGNDKLAADYRVTTVQVEERDPDGDYNDKE